MEVAPDGRMLLLNQAQSEITLRRTRWGPNQRLASSSFRVPGKPVRVANGPDGTVFVLDASGVLRRFTVHGQLLTIFDARGPSPTPLTSISDLVVTREGAVLVTDQASAAVVYQPGPGLPLRGDGAAARPQS